jgi:hypothetical protein
VKEEEAFIVHLRRVCEEEKRGFGEEKEEGRTSLRRRKGAPRE